MNPLPPLNTDPLHVRRHQSFQTRLLIWLIAWAAIISVTAGVVYYSRQVKFVEDEQRLRGKALVASLAGQSELGIYARDRSVLDGPARRIYAEDDIVFVAIYDMQGTTLLHHIKADTAADIPLSADLSKRLLHDRSGTAIIAHKGAYDQLWAPIVTQMVDGESLLYNRTSTAKPQVVGAVSLGLSRTPARHKLQEVIRWGVYVSLIILVMGALLAIGLARRIAYPIAALANGAEQIRAGNLGYHIELNRTDELGMLAVSFNRMSAQLADTVSSLAHLNKNLEAEVARRTEELEQRNLVLLQQRDQLQEMNRVKMQFLANTSHELRTPLNAIIGYTELILDGMYGELTEEQAESIGVINENAKQLLSLINNVLDLSKVEAGKMTLTVERVDLVALCQQTVDSIQPLTRQRPYRVTFSSDAPHIEVDTDEGKLRQILENMIANAIKFTDTGSVRVTLYQQSATSIAISVTDTGIGIAAEHLEIIFDEFRQVDGSSTRQHGGTGLGLAICRKIATLLGGTIHVESQLGRGSTFTLVLPTA